MKQNEDLNNALGKLKQEYLESEPPVSLETALHRAMDGLRPQSRTKVRTAFVSIWPVWTWPARTWQAGSAFAAALLIGIAVWLAHKPAGTHMAAAVNEPGKDKLAASVQASPKTSLVTARNTVPPPKNSKQRTRASEEIDTRDGFIALPGSEALQPPMEASIVRVQMMKGDLQRYGFDIPPAVVAETIRADFFLGEDGLPRAIRLVQ
jgi:hypothetical protein